MPKRAIFVDTNVLIYATEATSPFHEAATQKLFALWKAGDELWSSRQVLREFLVVRSRGQDFARPVPMPDLLTKLQEIENNFLVADDTAAVTAALRRLLATVEASGKQIHDANIVATMQVHRITQLLTHNVEDFMRFTHFITVLPLVEQETPNETPKTQDLRPKT